MTDRPIIFSGSMVRALLEGKKTQTRRKLQPQPPFSGGNASGVTSFGGWAIYPDSLGGLGGVYGRTYARGDRLWVREAWRTPSNFDARPPAALIKSCRVAGRGRPWCPIQFEADSAKIDHNVWRFYDPGRLRHALHLPRVYSRITLVVTDVRVQRLQDISDADAEAEGATSRPRCHGFRSRHDGWSMDWSRVGQLSRRPLGRILHERDVSLGSARMAFANYWNFLHGPNAWDENPWVVAITFDVHRRNIDDDPEVPDAVSTMTRKCPAWIVDDDDVEANEG